MRGIGLRVYPPRITFLATDVLLDWNESPIGPSDLAVQRVVRAAPFLHRYPRGVMEEVSELTASYLGVSPDEVLLTAGVDEAIDLALRLARRAWVVRPGFDGYIERADAAGRPLNIISLGPDWEPASQLDRGADDDDIVFLAQPNNPTGNVFGEQWLADLRRTASFVFLDETYVDFSTRPSALAETGREPGLLVFRSFSKALGLAGIRLGCLVASADTLALLRRSQRFLPIDSISLHAVAGTLEDTAHIERLTRYVREARPVLAELLRSSGLFGDVRDTETNFVLARPRPDAVTTVESALLGAGIKVKTCDPLGLPGWLRISVGSRDDLGRLGTCLSRIGTSTTRLPVLPAG